MIQRSKNLKRTLLKRRGRKANAWERFRNEKFERDKDEEGLIRCQDYRIGLSRCGVALPEMDLHHILGREGDLFLDETKMVWLTRDCHNEAHNPG